MSDSKQMGINESMNTELVEIAEGILFDARASIANKQVISMPIAQLATLGAGISSLIPVFSAITQANAASGGGLYRLANAAAGDTLKIAKNGNYWGAFKTAGGASKFVQLQAVGTTTAATSAVLPIACVTIVMAVALFSIEQKLDKIVKLEKQILSFLEIEKESEIEADIETLSSIISKYKYNWDNEHFITSNHKLVLDIQRTARKHMNAHQKQVTDILNAKGLLVSQSKVNKTLQELLKKFKYYRLSLYIFSMASFIEVMLSGDFKEDHLLCVKNEIEQMSSTYRDVFGKCSLYLEKLCNVSLETNILKGVGSASKSVGKLIESIPIIKEGPVDEFLQDSGTQMKNSTVRTEREVVEAFAEISNPGIGIFVEKMSDMIQIYGHTTEIYFDDKQIYLVAG